MDFPAVTVPAKDIQHRAFQLTAIKRSQQIRLPEHARRAQIQHVSAIRQLIQQFAINNSYRLGRIRQQINQHPRLVQKACSSSCPT